MLVLSRKKGDSVVIDGDIKITVLSVQGQTIRLGIEAPRKTAVFRSEVVDRIRSEGAKPEPPAKNRLWPTVPLATVPLATVPMSTVPLSAVPLSTVRLAPASLESIVSHEVGQ